MCIIMMLLLWLVNACVLTCIHLFVCLVEIATILVYQCIAYQVSAISASSSNKNAIVGGTIMPGRQHMPN